MSYKASGGSDKQMDTKVIMRVPFFLVEVRNSKFYFTKHLRDIFLATL